jgi:hypothetical protein
MVGEALRQVVGHRLAQRGSADQEMDMTRLPGQEQSRLARRVGATDDHGVPARVLVRLELARRVVDAASLELGETG